MAAATAGAMDGNPSRPRAALKEGELSRDLEPVCKFAIACSISGAPDERDAERLTSYASPLTKSAVKQIASSPIQMNILEIESRSHCLTGQTPPTPSCTSWVFASMAARRKRAVEQAPGSKAGEVPRTAP